MDRVSDLQEALPESDKSMNANSDMSNGHGMIQVEIQLNPMR